MLSLQVLFVTTYVLSLTTSVHYIHEESFTIFSLISDGSISLYNTEGSKFSQYKFVDARDVGWSVLSTAFRYWDQYYNNNDHMMMCYWPNPPLFYSPDQNWFIYSTWSPCSECMDTAWLTIKLIYIHVSFNAVHMCNVHGTDQHHYSLDLHPDEDTHFCAFCAIFSPDNKDILAA